MTRDELIRYRGILQERVRPLRKDDKGNAVDVLCRRVQAHDDLLFGLWEVVDELLARELNRQ